MGFVFDFNLFQEENTNILYFHINLKEYYLIELIFISHYKTVHTYKYMY
jgi:hypothetical protein